MTDGFWFTVDVPTDIVDVEHHTTVSQLQPGFPYRAEDVQDDWIVVRGPQDSRGLVPSAGVRRSAEELTQPAPTPSPPVALEPSPPPAPQPRPDVPSSPSAVEPGPSPAARVPPPPPVRRQPPPPAGAPVPGGSESAAGEPEAEAVHGRVLKLRVVASLVLMGSIFLEWFPDRARTAMDSPLAFLWDRHADSQGLKLGPLLLAAGVVALLSALVPKLARFGRVIGLAVVAVVVAFQVQAVIEIAESFDNYGQAVGSLFTDSFAVAPWLAFVAGVAMLTKK